MNLITQLIVRVILVVGIIDTIAFLLLDMNVMALTISYAAGVIVVTIVVLLISILFCLHKNERI